MQVSTSGSGGPAESSKGIAVFPTGLKTLFVLVTVLFFLWGMSNNLTDIVVQQFRRTAKEPWSARQLDHQGQVV